MTRGLLKLSKPVLSVIFILPVMIFAKQSNMIYFILIALQLIYIFNLIFIVFITANKFFSTTSKIFYFEGFLYSIALIFSSFQKNSPLLNQFSSTYFADLISLILFFIVFDFANRFLLLVHPHYTYKKISLKLFCIIATLTFFSGVFYVKDIMDKK